VTAFTVLGTPPTMLPEQCEWLSHSLAVNLGCFLAVIILRSYLLLRGGIPLRRLPIDFVLLLASTAFSSFSIASGMFFSILGKRVGFTPTGCLRTVRLDLVAVCGQMFLPWTMYIFIASVTTSRGFAGWTAISVMLSLLLAGTPIILRLFHYDQMRDES